MAKLDRLPRFLLLVASVACLTLGLLAGIQRLGWQWGFVEPALAVSHGPLMICGFLGTLISLERAVALGLWQGYAAPLLTAAGTVGLIAGTLIRPSLFVIALGSLVLVFLFIAVLLRQFAFHTVVMSLGAGAWLAGNAMWFVGAGIPQIAPWWIGFLVLTIAGERLELNRLLAPSRYSKLASAAAISLLATGLVCGWFLPTPGRRIVGFGMLALAAWLARFDVARFTVWRPGLPRFVALCLFAGYAWLGVGGLVWMLAAPVDATGSFSFFTYDAALHTVFLGFVFSMIFAHAPIVFPAVSGRALPFRHAFYGHVLLLHLSLIARVAGDSVGSLSLLKWAGIGNVIALLLFLANNACSILRRYRDVGVAR